MSFLTKFFSGIRQRNQVLLTGGVVLPVSRSQFGPFREALGRHIGIDLAHHGVSVLPEDPDPETT